MPWGWILELSDTSQLITTKLSQCFLFVGSMTLCLLPVSNSSEVMCGPHAPPSPSESITEARRAHLGSQTTQTLHSLAGRNLMPSKVFSAPVLTFASIPAVQGSGLTPPVWYVVPVNLSGPHSYVKQV